MLGLVFSGVTAFPLVGEVGLLLRVIRVIAPGSSVFTWIATVNAALLENAARFPFLAYGTDWLAFAHLVLAAAFIGPWRDPLRNKWVLQFGVIACAGVIPLALIAGHVRGIPLWWRMGDCCFGLCGAVPLCIALVRVSLMERNQRGVQT